MKTARAPLAVARTHGCRIVLADGRELIDGIASWWTACHGYNHPHIRQAVERQLALMPHVMFGGLAHEQALTLARRLAALLPGDLERVFFSESGSVAVEVAMKMAVQFWLNRGVRTRSAIPRLRGRLSRRHHRGDGDLRSRGRHACARSAGCCPSITSSICRGTRRSIAAFGCLLERHADELAGIIVEPLVQGAGGMRFHDPAGAAPAARGRRPLSSCC